MSHYRIRFIDAHGETWTANVTAYTLGEAVCRVRREYAVIRILDSRREAVLLA